MDTGIPAVDFPEAESYCKCLEKLSFKFPAKIYRFLPAVSDGHLYPGGWLSWGGELPLVPGKGGVLNFPPK